MNEENEEFEREMNYKPPSQIAMEAQAREFADGQEEKVETAKYITVLDFEVGRVIQYKVKDWDIDNESCDEFINSKGHRLSNCEWMVHENGDIINKTGDLPF